MGFCQTYSRLVAAIIVLVVFGGFVCYVTWSWSIHTNTINLFPTIYIFAIARLQEYATNNEARRRRCQCQRARLLPVTSGWLMSIIGIVRSTLVGVNFISFSVCDYSMSMIIWAEIAYMIDHGFQCCIYFNNACNIEEQIPLDNVDVLLVQVVIESLCALPFVVMFDSTISTTSVFFMHIIIGSIILKARCIVAAEVKKIRKTVDVQARQAARNITAIPRCFNLSLFCYCLVIVVLFNTLIIIQANDLDRILETKDISCARDLYYCTSVLKLERDCQRWTNVGNRHENESEVPPELLGYKHIKYIELTSTKIHSVPEVTKRWKQLVYLDMRNNQLKNFEVNTLEWENLQWLILDFNRELEKVPGVWEHPSLAVLSLANTSFQTMGSDRAYLPRLYYLDVGYSRVDMNHFPTNDNFPMLHTAIYSGIAAGSFFKYAGREIAIANADIETIRIPGIISSSRVRKFLDLRGNKIKTFDTQSLHLVQRWGTLLSGNPICLTPPEHCNCASAPSQSHKPEIQYHIW